jgi:glycine/D-amino acid oxidase-like deaminating enzyme
LLRKKSGHAYRKRFLVIGRGIAGLVFALQSANLGSVTIITKRVISASATKYAQGESLLLHRKNLLSIPMLKTPWPPVQEFVMEMST